VQANQTTTVDFALEREAAALEEMVVVGYGEQQRQDLTGAISSVPSEEFEELPLSSPEQALQGKIAGVRVTQSTGAPGGGVSVRVRGGNSILGGNEPLYVIDGFPVSQSEPPPTALAGDYGDFPSPSSPLASINPNDIASIEVLKDASATAIYGSRGANGVVIITTKQGQAGRTIANYSSYYGAQEVSRKYPLWDSEKYIAFANRSREAGGREIPYPDPVESYPNNDWQDMIFRTAPTMNHQLNISGGSESLRFVASGNYYNQRGIIKNSGFERYSLRASLDADLSNKLQVGTRISTSRADNNKALSAGGNNRDSGVIFAALHAPPTLPVQEDIDGTYVTAEESRLGGYSLNHDNPLAYINDMSDEVGTDRFIGSVFAEYDIIQDLTLKISAGADVSSQERNTFYTSRTRNGSNGGLGQVSTAEKTTLLSNNTLRYTKNVGETHDLEVLGGFTWQTQTYETSTLGGEGFPSDDFGTDNLESASSPFAPATDKTKWQLASWISRVNYRLYDRYLLTLTGRADGSSKFGSGNKWGFFPSAALAWRLSEESFFPAGAVSNLKLRLSYGVTGNEKIGVYQSLGVLSPANYSYGDRVANGLQPSSVANSDLKWEQTRQFNAGANVGFFDNRLTADLNYYYKRTEDLLLPVSLPFTSGFATSLQNSGSVVNEGFELGISGFPFVGDFQWEVSGNFSTNRNEIVELGQSSPFVAEPLTNYGWQNGPIVRPGVPIGAFYGYLVDGLFQSQQEIEEHCAQPEAVVGGRKVKDLNGDCQIDSKDRGIMGNPHPDFTFGLTNRVSYGGFDLSVYLQGSVGNDIMNMNNVFLEETTRALSNKTERSSGYWTPNNTDARFPKPDGSAMSTAQWYSDAQMVEDGSYLRVKNVTLGYDLPMSGLSFLGAAGMSSVRVYLSVQNVYTLTDYYGYNPDVNVKGDSALNRGIDLGTYPLARTYLVGINLRF